VNGQPPSQRPELWWWAQARSCLAAAERDLDSGFLQGAVSRAYYCCFHAVSAVLATKGQDYRRHSAVQSALHRDWVRPGLVSIQCGRLFDTLYNARHASDYQVFTEFDTEVVAQWLAGCHVLLDELAPHLADESADDHATAG